VWEASRGWTARLRGGATNAIALRFREQLGLPKGSPIVMSGHQPTLWHPGIAAKLFALRAIAERTGATPVWLVVDTDMTQPFALRVPTAADARGRVRAMVARLDSGGHASLSGGSSLVVPSMVGARALGVPASALAQAHPCVQAPLASLQGVLRAAFREGTLASQATKVQQSIEGLREAFAGVLIVYASSLAQTDAFAALRSALVRSEAPREMYNDAARQHPAARMRPLRAGELPLWRLATASRTPVMAGDASGVGVEAPRAIITTLLMRALGCELFVHGLGGGEYDKVLEAWVARAGLGRLLGGDESVFVAPAVVASATLRLPLVVPAPHAAGRRHKAMHTPSLLGDAGSQRQKDELVRAIRASSGNAKKELYRELCALLERVRAAHGATLSDFALQDEASRELAGSVAVARDRTMACALHKPARLHELAAHVSRRVHEALALDAVAQEGA
jgi:hypothetical protein